MDLTRRTFVSVTAAGAASRAGLMKSVFGVDLGVPRARTAAPLRGTLTTTICPFCSVGCGMLVATEEGKVVHLMGDPDHPINEGATCSKGAALRQIWNSDQRVTKVRYRAPGASTWVEKDWAWAVPQIARRIKATRDATFEARDAQGRVVNRTTGLACLGGAALDNEECYSLGKLARALGTVYLENHARL